MDIISSSPFFKRRILIVWSAVLLTLHTVLTLLSVYNKYISGDIMKQDMSTALAVILPIVAMILFYVRLGVLVSVYHSYYTGTFPFTLVAMVSLVLARFSESIVYLASGTMPEYLRAYLFSVITAFMIDLAVVLLLFLFSRGKKERNRRVIFLILIACALPFAISVFDEISFVWMFWMNDLGGQIIFTESMIYPFINILIEAAAGFVIMLATHTLLKKLGK